jgi:signal transduction histidine kinase
VLSLIVTAAVAIVAFLLARTVTLPVERLKGTARAMAGGDLSARAATNAGAPELRELAQILNETAGRLEETLAAQQAFVADASHQLRTPLAALRLQLENLDSDAPPALQDGLAAARAETARLSRISEALLALTRSAGAAVACEAIDAAAVARERCAIWESVTAEADVRLELHAPAHLWVTAAPGALEQILDNLIDNALGVSPPGSTIRVEAGSSGHVASLHVVDEGAGLEPEQRRRAFDRFWRGPNASPGGTGLGLPIVAQLAARCDGHAELRAVPSGGIDAVVTLATAHSPRPHGAIASR